VSDYHLNVITWGNHYDNLLNLFVLSLVKPLYPIPHTSPTLIEQSNFKICDNKFIVKFSFSPPTYYLQLVNWAISYMFTHESTILNVCYYFILMVFCFTFKNYINMIGSMYQKINTLQLIHYIDVKKFLMFNCVAYILIISIVWTYFESLIF
jgi:hypothetical protein